MNINQLFKAISAVLAVSIAPIAHAEELPSSATDIASRRELFIDSFLIDRFVGKAEQRLHKPIPREIAIVHDAPWE
nr:hypothetical protein [Pirellulaceae bacterium]